MSIANYAENKLLDTLRDVSFSVAEIWVQLHDADPGENCTSNVIAGEDRSAATFAEASNGTMSSDADVTWVNLASTSTISHISLWDAASSGNALWYGALSQPKQVNAGDTFTISSGNLSLSLD